MSGRTAPIGTSTPLALTPKTATNSQAGVVTLVATGGVSPYRYTAPTNGSGGSFTANAWTIGAVGSTTDKLRVTDALDDTEDCTVTVTAALSISPTTATVETGLTQQFTASGGAGSYVYSISTNNTGGSISGSGLYTCGTITGAGNDTVRATDANGATADAVVTPSWSPFALGSLLSWHRADRGVTTGATYTWANQGGAGDSARNATQSTGAKQPSSPAANAKLNNQLSITFASSQGLVTGTYSTVPAAPLLIGIVFSDGASGKYLIDSKSGDAQQCRMVVDNGAGFTLGGNSVIQGSAYDTNGHMTLGKLNGVSSSERKDNVTTTDVTGTTSFTASGFTFGDNNGLGAFASSKIAEIFICNADLSTADKASLRSYIQTRYGLTIGA